MKAALPGFDYDPKTRTARFECCVPGASGRARRRKTIRNTTRAEALTAWKEFREKVEAGEIEREIWTFKEYADKYHPQMAMRTAESTRRSEKSILKKLNAHFGTLRLDRITAAHVRDFVAALRGDGLSAASVNSCLRVLVKILRDAVDRECLDMIRIRGRIKLREELPRLEMTAAEQARFLAAFDDETAFRRHLAESRRPGTVSISAYYGDKPRVFGGPLKPDGAAAGYYFERFRWSRPLFVIALETGLRRGDLLDLRWDAVDVPGRTIRVKVRKTKETALIALSPACIEALEECRRRKVRGAHVLLNPEGHPYSTTHVRDYFLIAKKLAGIDRRLRFHDLRHTFASNLAAMGVSLQLIQRQLGHASITQTERYSRVSEDAIRELGNFLFERALARTQTRTRAISGGSGDAS